MMCTGTVQVLKLFQVGVFLSQLSKLAPLTQHSTKNSLNIQNS